MLETLRSYWSIISTIITVVAVPAVGYLYKKYKQADARQKAVELGVQALLRDRIVQSYYHYEERGWITLHGLENVNAMYKEYHALGGNGTVTALVKQEQVQQNESAAVVERTFDGSLPRFVAAFLNTKPISKEEAAAIRKLLDEAEAGKEE